jgi:hypothetical protein
MGHFLFTRGILRRMAKVQIDFVPPVTITDRKGNIVSVTKRMQRPDGGTVDVTQMIADQCKCVKASLEEHAGDASKAHAKKDCDACKGKGATPAMMTMPEYCEHIANDPVFAKHGSAGNRAGLALVRGACDAEERYEKLLAEGDAVNAKASFFLTAIEHAIVKKALAEPSPENVLPSAVARCTVAFEAALNRARDVDDE